MENPITNFDAVSDEKVDFIETQAQRNLEFRIESMKILSEQAMVTLNWLFALAVTPAGYVFSKADTIVWWIAFPALVCSAGSGITAIYLFKNALKTKAILPAGNEPKNLVSDASISGELKWIRLAEICNIQDRIEIVIAHNDKAGSAINNSRIAMIAITGGCLVLLGLCYAFNCLWVC